MAKPHVKNFQLLSKRSYAVPTENPSMQAAAVTELRQEKDTKADEDIASERKQNFWMKDPKTGNWIPESHFGQIDAAELRRKMLPKKE